MGATQRVAIVGAGGIARRHARACREVTAAELVAVVDVQAAAAERLADEFAVAGRYTDLTAMVERERPDLVVVATWGDSHAAVTEALAATGRVRAVLCEKPFSRNADEAASMCRAAEAAGMVLLEAFKFRYHPAHLTIIDLLAAGSIGRLDHLRSTFVTAMPPAMRAADQNWRYNAARGGGAIYDLACYCVHQARWVMAGEPMSVQAIGRWDAASGVDESVTAMMRFSGDRTASWWVSFVDQPAQSVEMFGTEGIIRLDQAWNNEDRSTVVELIRRDGQRRQLAMAPVFQFARQLQYLCDCLIEGRAPALTAASSIAQMRVLDALYASLRSGQPVTIEQSSDGGQVRSRGGQSD